MSQGQDASIRCIIHGGWFPLFHENREIRDGGKLSLEGIAVPYNRRAKLSSRYDEMYEPECATAYLDNGGKCELKSGHFREVIASTDILRRDSSLTLIPEKDCLRFRAMIEPKFAEMVLGKLDGPSYISAEFLPIRTLTVREPEGFLISRQILELRAIAMTDRPVHRTDESITHQEITSNRDFERELLRPDESGWLHPVEQERLDNGLPALNVQRSRRYF
ncbi:MAG: hypothetical protein OXL96_11845 [Candidatus Poribacteria bacterium]|nr:hypothetical protein [Candidatus Poribacteria bacterium]